MGKAEAAVHQKRCYPWLRLGAWRLPLCWEARALEGRPAQWGGTCEARGSGFFPAQKALNTLVTDKTDSSFWNAVSA